MLQEETYARLRRDLEVQVHVDALDAPGEGAVFLADCDVSEEQKQTAMKERADLIQQGEWEKEGITYEPKETKPLEEFMKPQGRFSHLFKDDRGKAIIVEAQRQVDAQWELLKKRQAAFGGD